MRVASLILALVSIFALLPAQAASYSIQIGAYRDPSAAETTRASDIGDISMHPGRDGLTRIRVGRFESEQEARAALQRLQAAGYYADAYISDENGRQVGHSYQIQPGSRPAHSEAQRLVAAKAKVPSDQYSNIVYLDGRLMLKEGDTFRALE